MAMTVKSCALLVFLGYILQCKGKEHHLPSEFKTCSRSSENYDECLTEAIQIALPLLGKGVPELNLEPLEPIRAPELTIGAGSGAVNVVQKYKNVEFYNATNGKVLKTHTAITDKGFDMHIELFYNEVTLKADYDFNGRILVLPIVGVGKCTLTLVDLNAKINLKGEVIKQKGKDYVEVTDVKVELKAGKALYDFKNLFNGDERLGNEVNKLLNDNGNEVFEEVRHGYEEGIAAIYKNLANLIYKKVIYQELHPL